MAESRSSNRMASSKANSQKEDVFKPVKDRTPQNADIHETETHGSKEDLTAETEVKVPGILQRAVEEVQAIAAEIWAAITPGSKK